MICRITPVIGVVALSLDFFSCTSPPTQSVEVDIISSHEASLLFDTSIEGLARVGDSTFDGNRHVRSLAGSFDFLEARVSSLRIVVRDAGMDYYSDDVAIGFCGNDSARLRSRIMGGWSVVERHVIVLLDDGTLRMRMPAVPSPSVSCRFVSPDTRDVEVASKVLVPQDCGAQTTLLLTDAMRGLRRPLACEARYLVSAGVIALQALFDLDDRLGALSVVFRASPRLDGGMAAYSSSGADYLEIDNQTGRLIEDHAVVSDSWSLGELDAGGPGRVIVDVDETGVRRSVGGAVVFGGRIDAVLIVFGGN